MERHLDNIKGFINTMAQANNRKRAIVFLALLLTFVVSITTTLALTIGDNAAINPTYENREEIEFTFTLLEIQCCGTRTDNPIPDAEFILEDLDNLVAIDPEEDEEEYEYEGEEEYGIEGAEILVPAQIMPNNNPLFITDENGQFVLNLAEGRYRLTQVGFSFEFGPEIEGGVPIRHWYFEVRRNADDYLELWLYDPTHEDADADGFRHVEELTFHAFNQLNCNSLVIEKTVVNEAGHPLEDWQLEMYFYFLVTFDDDFEGEREYHVYDDEGNRISESIIAEHGHLFRLRHGQRAVFGAPGSDTENYLPYGIGFRVREVNVPRGFSASVTGCGGQGVIGVGYEDCLRLNEENDFHYNFVGFVNTYSTGALNDLLVTKDVRNLDGSPLSEALLNREFSFVVTLDPPRSSTDDDEDEFEIEESEVESEETYDSENEGESEEGEEADEYDEYDESEIDYEDESEEPEAYEDEDDDDDEEHEETNEEICERMMDGGFGTCRFTLRHGFSIDPSPEHSFRLFENIPVGTRFTVWEGDYTGEGIFPGIISRQGYITAEGIIEIHFINTFIGEEVEGEGDLEISKTVIGADGQEIDYEQLFDFSLIFTHITGATEEEPLTIYMGVYPELEPFPVTGSVFQVPDGFGLAHGERFVVQGLPHGTRYDVIEAETPGFIQEVRRERGMIFAEETMEVDFYNEMYPEDVTSLNICKIITNENPNFLSEALFNFVLYINGEEYYRFSQHANECYTIEDLQLDAEFEVIEIDIDERYTLVESRNNTGTITEEPITVEFINRDLYRYLPVVKFWDFNDVEAAMPTYITIHLLDEGNVIDIVQIRPDENGEWSHVFLLPRYRDGELIEYRIVELPVSGWTDEISAYDDIVVITNTAVPRETVVIPVRKQITGELRPTVVQAFEFILTPVDRDNPMPPTNRIVINGEGVANFPPIAFEEPGVFEYTVHEMVPSDQGGYTFDTRIFDVTITVTQDGDYLNTEIEISSEDVEVVDIVFVNHYNGTPEGGTDDDEEPGDETGGGGAGTPEDDTPTQSQPPQTGDDTQLTMWIILTILSGVTLVLYTLRSYVKHKEVI